MKALEFGNPSNPAVSLIHKMKCGGRHSFDKAIELLQEKAE